MAGVEPLVVSSVGLQVVSCSDAHAEMNRRQSSALCCLCKIMLYPASRETELAW
jgi:hypothetical protein